MKPGEEERHDLPSFRKYHKLTSSRKTTAGIK
jgi:hypothetical protein